jgi:hypothetical protein
MQGQSFSEFRQKETAKEDGGSIFSEQEIDDWLLSPQSNAPLPVQNPYGI